MASAWDDDWETTADRQESMLPDPALTAAPEPKISRAQRKILHHEANRQLWQAADTPKDTPIFIQARNAPPPLASATPIKQAVKVLARRPSPAQPPQANKKGAEVVVDDEPDSEEEERQRSAAAFAERQERAAREREEKQRKYAEVRERLFGADSQSGAPTTASPRQQGQNLSRPSSSGPNTPRGTNNNGRGRGGAVRSGRDGSKQLYDPDSSSKPDSAFAQRREGTRAPLQSDIQKPIREPRGPDYTGRGFAPRNKVTDKATEAGT